MWWSGGGLVRSEVGRGILGRGEGHSIPPILPVCVNLLYLCFEITCWESFGPLECIYGSEAKINKQTQNTHQIPRTILFAISLLAFLLSTSIRNPILLQTHTHTPHTHIHTHTHTHTHTHKHTQTHSHTDTHTQTHPNERTNENHTSLAFPVPLFKHLGSTQHGPTDLDVCRLPLLRDRLDRTLCTPRTLLPLGTAKCRIWRVDVVVVLCCDVLCSAVCVVLWVSVVK
jgi:hypothetical protein